MGEAKSDDALFAEAQQADIVQEQVEALSAIGWTARPWEEARIERDDQGNVLVALPAQRGETLEQLDVLYVLQGGEEPATVLRPASQSAAAALSKDINKLAPSGSTEGETLQPQTYAQSAACQYIKKVGLNIGCVILDENPLGYYYTTYVRTGYTKCCPSQPAWWADYHGNLVVCPGVQTNFWSWATCGYPPY